MQRLLSLYGRRPLLTRAPPPPRPVLLQRYVFSSKNKAKNDSKGAAEAYATFESSESFPAAFNMTPMDRLTRLKPMITEDNDNNDDLKAGGEKDPYEGRPHDPQEKMYTDWDEESEPDPRLLLGKKLLQLGRVYYRFVPSVISCGFGTCNNKLFFAAQAHRAAAPVVGDADEGGNWLSHHRADQALPQGLDDTDRP